MSDSSKSILTHTAGRKNTVSPSRRTVDTELTVEELEERVAPTGSALLPGKAGTN